MTDKDTQAASVLPEPVAGYDGLPRRVANELLAHGEFSSIREHNYPNAVIAAEAIIKMITRDSEAQMQALADQLAVAEKERDAARAYATMIERDRAEAVAGLHCIASMTQTTNLLWWQNKARETLKLMGTLKAKDPSDAK